MLVVVDALLERAMILTNNGAGQFSVSHKALLSAMIPPSVAVDDFNGDQRLDVVVVNREDFTITVLLNRNGRYPADLDSDNDVDLADLQLLLVLVRRHRR